MGSWAQFAKANLNALRDDQTWAVRQAEEALWREEVTARSGPAGEQ